MVVQEPSDSLFDEMPRMTERHLQCVWYDEKLRPELRTEAGEKLTVIQPGRWNLEAGPDFLGAEIRVGRRRIRGDVEIHIRPGDWKAHGHTEDVRYADVVLHVTYFPVGTNGNAAEVPSHIIPVSLESALQARKGFALEDIDIAAYPHAVFPTTPRPCGETLEKQGPDQWRALLMVAGRHRMRRKAARMKALLAKSGDLYQVFYEEAMAMLGAKGNTTAFRKIAELLPLTMWEEGASEETRYAQLLGVAGLLPEAERMRHECAQDFVKGLRAEWFRVGGGADSIRDMTEWNLSGMRPANRPERRLAAAALLFHDRARLDALLSNEKPGKEWFRKRLELLTSLPPMDYWATRVSLDSEPGKKDLAALGESRAAVIITNVLVPLRMALDRRHGEELLGYLPPEDLGSPGREVAVRLFGRDHNPSLYMRSGLYQQGLLAIHRDFCLRVEGGCKKCPLAKRLNEGWRSVP